MDKTVLISIPVEDLEMMIIGCVTTCLKHHKEPQPEEPDQYLTVPQVAKFLSLAQQTIYAMVHRNEIPVCKRNKRLYFSRQELTEWVQAGRKVTIDEVAQQADQHLKQ